LLINKLCAKQSFFVTVFAHPYFAHCFLPVLFIIKKVRQKSKEQKPAHKQKPRQKRHTFFNGAIVKK